MNATPCRFDHRAKRHDEPDAPGRAARLLAEQQHEQGEESHAEELRAIFAQLGERRRDQEQQDDDQPQLGGAGPPAVGREQHERGGHGRHLGAEQRAVASHRLEGVERDSPSTGTFGHPCDCAAANGTKSGIEP